MMVGCVEGLEGHAVRGWAFSNENTCRVSVADADGNIVANGTGSRNRQALDRPPYHYTFRLPIGFHTASTVLRVFADGQELAGSPIALGSNLFDGAVSVIDGRITGWVQERASDTVPRQVEIHDHFGHLIATVLPQADSPDGPYRFEMDAPACLYGWPEIGLSAVCGGSIFAKTTCSLPVEGYLDRVEPRRLAGWALIPGLSEHKLRLKIYLDDKSIAEVICDTLRSDLRAKYPDAGQDVLRCGFDLTLPAPVSPTAARTLSLRLADNGVELFNSPRGIGDMRWAVQTLRKANQTFAGFPAFDTAETGFLRQTFASLATRFREAGPNIGFKGLTQPVSEAGQAPRLSLVIPVYRDVDMTRRCIESVLAHRCGSTDTVIVINDKSPDLAMSAMLESAFGRVPNFWILSNSVNRGFVCTVNRGLGMAQRGDVILLNSDTELYSGGLDELVRCAALSESVGTVTPLSNAATIFTYPHPTRPAVALDDITWPDVAALALRQSRQLIDVPTGHGFCLYIKREVLDQVGLLDEVFGRGYGEENDFCQRASDLGYRHFAAATVFVRHHESASFSTEKEALRAHNLGILRERYPEWQANIEQWERDDALRIARWPIDRHRLRAAYEGGARFMVSVENDVTGGTRQAIDDLEEHVGFNGREVARCCAEGDLIVLRIRALGIISCYHADEVDALFETIGCMQPSLYVVHQLLGYGETFIHSLSEASAKTRTVFIAHDFYAACPRTTMIDATERFCGGPSSRCTACVRLGGTHLRGRLEMQPEQHRALLGGFLRLCAQVVAPSRDTADRLEAALPGLSVSNVQHPELRPTAVLPRRQARNRNATVILGAIGPHKGSASLLELVRVATIDAPNLCFHIVGYTDIDKTLAQFGNVVIHGKYSKEQITSVLGKINAATALFLHQWPETYSYTFSEAVRHGMVPVLLNLGAPAERLRRLDFGKFISFPPTPFSILEAISKVGESDVRKYSATMSQINRETQASIESWGKIIGGT